MTQPVPSLPVLRLAGLHLDTLGNYFAALGLLRLAAHRWPAVKGCWRDGVFCLIGGPDNISELEAFEYEYTRTGVRYTAPPGMHDDCVCALALAVRRATITLTPPSKRVIFDSMQLLRGIEL